MVRRAFAGVLLSVAALAGFPSGLMAQLQSVEQALEVSRKTGKPIFAMAGNKT